MVTILRNPQASSDSVRFVQDELTRIARAVDKQNEERKN
jgi:succinylglutamate desuccinylase